MIEYSRTDIFAAPPEAAIVNTVNCVGVMGKGLALQFKNRYPENYRMYREVCSRGALRPGTVMTWVEDGRTIINFPTKDHWREPSRLADVEEGLGALRAAVEKRKLKAVVVPPLGCGLGGLNWKDVKPLIERALGDLAGVKVTVIEPGRRSTGGRR